MTEHYNVGGRRATECVDKHSESIPGSGESTDGALFYHIEATCNGIPCPPYDPEKELTLGRFMFVSTVTVKMTDR